MTDQPTGDVASVWPNCWRRCRSGRAFDRAMPLPSRLQGQHVVLFDAARLRPKLARHLGRVEAGRVLLEQISLFLNREDSQRLVNERVYRP